MNPASLGGVADPRLGKEADGIPNMPKDVSAGTISGLRYAGHDKSISFEEYLYYASWTRNFERSLSVTGRGMSSIKTMFVGKNKSAKATEAEMIPAGAPPVATSSPSEDNMQSFGVISDYEWHHASRAARTATWGQIKSGILKTNSV